MYCINCGNEITTRYLDDQGNETPEYTRIEYYCPVCNETWTDKQNIDEIKNLIERIKRIEELLGL